MSELASENRAGG